MAVVLVFAVLLADPPRVLLLLSVAYALSGPLQALWKWWHGRRSEDPAARQSPADHEPD